MLLDLLYSEDIDIKDLEKYFLASSQGQAPGFSPKNFITVIKTTIILSKQTRCSISPVLPTTNSRILLVASLILHSKYYAGLFLPFSYLSALIYVHSFPNPMQVCDLLQIHLPSSQQLEFELSYHFPSALFLQLLRSHVH